MKQLPIAYVRFQGYNGAARTEKAIEYLAEKYEFEFIVIRR